MNLLYLDNNISDIIFNNNYVNQNLLSLVNKEINSIVKIKIIKFKFPDNNCQKLFSRILILNNYSSSLLIQ